MRKYAHLTEEEIEALPTTRQYKNQIRAFKKGICVRCLKAPTREGKTRCEECAIKGGTKRPHIPKKVWAAVDWSRSAKEIAIDIGTTPQCVVRYARKMRKRMPADSKRRWDNIDWNLSRKEIAFQLKVTPEAVGQQYRKRNPKP